MKINKNTDQFLQIIESHKGIIYKVANSYCNDADDRNDLAQEIILKIWKSFDTYKEEYKYSTWIYRIALNTAISNYRKEKVREKYAAPLMETFISIPDESVSNENEQKYALLQRFISELKVLDKALMLLYLEEKTYKEIAEILGISETNVGTKMGRIKETLKQKFTKANTL